MEAGWFSLFGGADSDLLRDAGEVLRCAALRWHAELVTDRAGRSGHCLWLQAPRPSVSTQGSHVKLGHMQLLRLIHHHCSIQTLPWSLAQERSVFLAFRTYWRMLPVLPVLVVRHNDVAQPNPDLKSSPELSAIPFSHPCPR